MEFKEISTNDYPLFHDLLNDYYREGEDEGTENAGFMRVSTTKMFSKR